MITNTITQAINTLLFIIVFPFQIVSTFVLGLLVSITFGLFLLPISAIWIVLFFAPLIGLSYVYEKVKVLRIPISIIGVPIAVAANIYASLMPSMGEQESRSAKLVFAWSFPYNYSLFSWRKNQRLVDKGNFFALKDILQQMKKGNAHITAYIKSLG